jgi:hypothetical protein
MKEQRYLNGRRVLLVSKVGDRVDMVKQIRFHCAEI